MELTEEQIEKLKSLVRVSMDMHDIDNWKNGDYFGDARKFWKGAMSGIDLWVKQLSASQKASTSESALPISDVVGQSEQLAQTSCFHACSPSDYYKGGKCDKMGCYKG